MPDISSSEIVLHNTFLTSSPSILAELVQAFSAFASSFPILQCRVLYSFLQQTSIECKHAISSSFWMPAMGLWNDEHFNPESA